ncbi:MAG: WecB/TagA/CpsF family glycosyltransferase [Chloroflexales bacterium]|nr:WecB/TagA/CpsF family glycosyltransferase [Chloroflexales bacterium]
MRKLLVILGVPVDNLSMDEAMARCDAFIATGRATGRTAQIATVNADFVVNSLHDPELRRILQEADMSTADGMPLVWASRMLGGPLPGRVTGADMVPALAKRAAEKGYSIYFLGARPGVAAKAADILQQRNPGLKVAGVYSPPPAPVLEMDRTAVEMVKEAKPDILLVAFGNPKQEKWIRMHAPELQVPIAVGIGGTLDMIVGVTKRAPSWMQKVGLEWAYRMAQEPRRLVKRYLHDFGYFGYFFVQQWWAMRKGTAISMIPVEPPPMAPAAPAAPAAPTVDEGASTDTMAVLRPKGRIDVTNTSQFFEQAQVLLERSPYLTVSLKMVTFLDSTALGALVGLANQARAAGGALYLVEMPKPISDLFTLVRLEHFFEVHADPESAERHRSTPPTPPTPVPAPSGWAVVKAPRIFDAGTAPALLERCTDRAAEMPRLVVDLSETVFLASAGMAALIRLDRLTQEHNGMLRVAGCSPDVLRTLKLVKLDSILKIFGTAAEAMTTPLGDSQTLPTMALPAQH